MLTGKKDNRVIIRIWTSKRNEGQNVGHISIETPNRYMSLWPDSKDNGSGVLTPIVKEFKLNADADIDEEGRVAERVYCFYSLNAVAMEAKFDSIHNDNDFRGWTLIGDNLLFNQRNAHSCSSLAYALLLAGGIYTLLPRGYSASFSSITTPDMLAAASARAKAIEISTYPDTSKYELFSRSTVIKGVSYTESETVIKISNSNWRCYVVSGTVALLSLGLFAYRCIYSEVGSNSSQPFKMDL